MWQHTGTRQGRRRLFEHKRSQGEQVEILSGIGEDNQTLDTGGRARYLETRGKLIFQNKTGNDETRHESKHKT